MTTAEEPFWEAVDRVRSADPRFRREAYGFVMFALARTVDALPSGRRADPERRHLSGAELVAGVIRCARREFGTLAPMVFEEWAVRRSEDVGDIVFQMVDAGQLSARPEDRREDFAGRQGLIEALGGANRPGRADPAQGPAGPGASA